MNIFHCILYQLKLITISFYLRTEWKITEYFLRLQITTLFDERTTFQIK